MGARKILAATALAGAVAWAGAANAALVLVGSWRVDQGPAWNSGGPDGPLAYTGQEAAAALFGGDASKYVISTDAAKANGMAWYAILGYSAAGLFEQDFDSKYLGKYYGPTADHGSGSFVVSAYVQDLVLGDKYTNYAFVDDGTVVPEPATWALMIGGFGLAGAALRRRRNAAAA